MLANIKLNHEVSMFKPN